MPGSQATQDVLPRLNVYLPLLQSRQLDWFLSGWYFPAEHEVQLLAAGPLKVPAGQ